MTNQNTVRSSTLTWMAVIATVLALGVHAYLLSEHYELKYGQVSEQSICNINAVFNCAAVSASSYSELMGFPVALLGFASNAVLLLLLIWYWLSEGESRPTARAAVLSLSTFIALTSVVMALISSLVLHRYCPFCMGAYALSFIAVGCLWAALKNPPPGPIGKGLAVPITFALIAALAVKIADDQIRSTYKSDDLARYAQEKIQNWLNTPASNFETLDPLVEGASKENAKMTIVEFADFRCSHCKHAAPVLHAFTSAHSDVRLEFLAWPLDGECNTAIPTANGASCLLARAVYCARKEGGNGWAAHRWVYDHQEDYGSVDIVKAKLPEIASAAGISLEKMLSCSNSDEVKLIVSKQAEIGSALKLPGTPSIYVNGKRLEGGQFLPVLSEAYKKLQ